ncbi:MAG: hypothetical protein HKM05_00660 [Spirochaetales bacterium]|nr:hypothetical protein [Spirochaetales bacterium]
MALSNLSFEESGSLVFQRSRTELVFHLLSASLCAVASIAAWYATVIKPWPWSWLLAIGLVSVVLFLTSAFRSLRKFYLVTESQGLEVRWKNWGRWHRLVVANLVELKSIPCWRRTLLVTPEQTLVLPHQLSGCEFLLKRLRQARPDLLPSPKEIEQNLSLVLRASLVPSVFYVLFMGAIVGAAWALLPLNAQYFTLFFLVFPLFRLLWRTPRRYYITDQGVTVFFWVTKKVWLWSEVESWSEDTYASTAASFYLMKFLFRGGSVVLDESLLVTPLHPYKDWILNRFFSSGNSVYF